MDKLTARLKHIVTSASNLACYAINTKKRPIVGMKIDLSTEQLSEFMEDTIGYLCSKIYDKNSLATIQSHPQKIISKYCLVRTSRSNPL